VEAEPNVTDLVHAAVLGDESAWGSLVERYTPLLMSVLRGYRLRDDDLRDVAQTVWLRLVEHLGNLREPRALPMWIITTAKNESVRVLKAGARTQPFSAVFEDELPEQPDSGEVDRDLLRDERRRALLEAFAELPTRDRDLLALLVADPPIAYAEISARLGMPVGSIGPTRARVLAKLRATPALAALDPDAVVNGSAGPGTGGGGRRGATAVGRR
jgi:RNA polymerase sigma factor (sigma-70 family)